eukprot:jgi/Mesen1/7391/ME000388S06611
MSVVNSVIQLSITATCASGELGRSAGPYRSWTAEAPCREAQAQTALELKDIDSLVFPHSLSKVGQDLAALLDSLKPPAGFAEAGGSEDPFSQQHFTVPPSSDMHQGDHNSSSASDDDLPSSEVKSSGALSQLDSVPRPAEPQVAQREEVPHFVTGLQELSLVPPPEQSAGRPSLLSLSLSPSGQASISASEGTPEDGNATATGFSPRTSGETKRAHPSEAGKQGPDGAQLGGGPDVTSEATQAKTPTKRRRHSRTDRSDLPDDGQHWRKYGQKDLTDSPFVRSYYWCSRKQEGCTARRWVDRHAGRQGAVRISYEGRHNHPPPGTEVQEVVFYAQAPDGTQRALFSQALAPSSSMPLRPPGYVRPIAPMPPGVGISRQASAPARLLASSSSGTLFGSGSGAGSGHQEGGGALMQARPQQERHPAVPKQEPTSPLSDSKSLPGGTPLLPVPSFTPISLADLTLQPAQVAPPPPPQVASQGTPALPGGMCAGPPAFPSPAPYLSVSFQQQQQQASSVEVLGPPGGVPGGGPLAAGGGLTALPPPKDSHPLAFLGGGNALSCTDFMHTSDSVGSPITAPPQPSPGGASLGAHQAAGAGGANMAGATIGDNAAPGQVATLHEATTEEMGLEGLGLDSSECGPFTAPEDGLQFDSIDDILDFQWTM